MTTYATMMTFWTAFIYAVVPPATYGEILTMRIVGVCCGAVAIIGLLEIIFGKSKKVKSK